MSYEESNGHVTDDVALVVTRDPQTLPFSNNR